MVKAKERQKESFWVVSRPIIISAVCGAAMIAALLAIASVVLLYTGQINPIVTSSVVIAVSAAGAVFAGFLVGKITRKNGLIYGGITGLLLYFLVLIVSVACGVFQLFTVSTVIRLAVMTLGGALGGLIAVNQKRKVK